MTSKILTAGFGGQGILFVGKFLAYKGLLEGKQLSWLPSYGPEMRGGTANCNIIVSDEPVGSPIVFEPDILIVMNRPSLDKYESEVVPGGLIMVDSAMVDREVERKDVSAVYIPATTLAAELGTPGLANMVLVGKLLKECPELAGGDIEAVLSKVISARHQDLSASNLNAIKKGMGY